MIPGMNPMANANAERCDPLLNVSFHVLSPCRTNMIVFFSILASVSFPFLMGVKN